MKIVYTSVLFDAMLYDFENFLEEYDSSIDFNDLFDMAIKPYITKGETKYYNYIKLSDVENVVEDMLKLINIKNDDLATYVYNDVVDDSDTM